MLHVLWHTLCAAKISICFFNKVSCTCDIHMCLAFNETHSDTQTSGYKAHNESIKRYLWGWETQQATGWCTFTQTISLPLYEKNVRTSQDCENLPFIFKIFPNVQLYKQKSAIKRPDNSVFTEIHKNMLWKHPKTLLVLQKYKKI